MPSQAMQIQQLTDKIAQLDAVLAGGAERVPTELGPVQYNLEAAEKERARLMRRLDLLSNTQRRTRLIAVWPTRT